MGEELAHFQTTLSMLAKFPRGCEELALLAKVQFGRIFSIPFSQLRLRIKRIHLRGATRHEKKNDAFRAGRYVGLANGQRLFGCRRLRRKQSRQCNCTQSTSGTSQNLATIQISQHK